MPCCSQCSAAPTCPATAGQQVPRAPQQRRRAPANCRSVKQKRGGGQCSAVLLAVQRCAHLPSNRRPSGASRTATTPARACKLQERETKRGGGGEVNALLRWNQAARVRSPAFMTPSTSALATPPLHIKKAEPTLTLSGDPSSSSPCNMRETGARPQPKRHSNRVRARDNQQAHTLLWERGNRGPIATRGGVALATARPTRCCQPQADCPDQRPPRSNARAASLATHCSRGLTHRPRPLRHHSQPSSFIL